MNSSAKEMSDYMPIGLHIRLNNTTCPLPPMPDNKCQGFQRRLPNPINITPHMKLNPNISNIIIINWIPDNNKYVFTVSLVEKLNHNMLLKQLKDKQYIHLNNTKKNIIKKLTDVDPDLATTLYRFSLDCPLSKVRMTIPVKSINCDHFQCFDGRTFILMNEKKPTWKCPTCNKPCYYDDLQIDSYFLQILTSSNLPRNCKEIEILADGTWKVFDETNKNKKFIEKDNIRDKRSNMIPCINIVDDDTVCSCIDLTLSDED